MVDSPEVLPAEVEIMSTERMVFYTDAVAAIAITLLAIDLPLPQGTTNADWLHSARGFFDEYLAFGISFVVIAAYWRGHHSVFRQVQRVEPVIGLNLLWLFFIVTIPFVTKVLSGDGAFQARFILYAGVQVLAAWTFIAILVQLRRRDLLRPDASRGRIRSAMINLIGMSSAFLISIPFSLFTPWAYAWWVAIPVLTRLVRRVSGRFSPQ
jgi:uncharacterized membrane protein